MKLDNRKNLVAQHADRQLLAANEALDQHRRVELERVGQRRSQLVPGRGRMRTDAGTLGVRLDENRQRQSDLFQASYQLPFGRGHALQPKLLLRLLLVEG